MNLLSNINKLSISFINLTRNYSEFIKNTINMRDL